MFKYWRCGGSFVALHTTETVVPGSNPASLTVGKTLRTGRVTVYTVKSLGRKRNLPLRPKKILEYTELVYIGICIEMIQGIEPAKIMVL